MCWQSLGYLQQKAIDQILLGNPRKRTITHIIEEDKTISMSVL